MAENTIFLSREKDLAENKKWTQVIIQSRYSTDLNLSHN